MIRKSPGLLILALLVAGAGCGLYEYSTTWTRSQQQQDPAGYIGSLMCQLQDELGRIHPLRDAVQQQLQLVVEAQQRIEVREREAARVAVELRELLSSGRDRVLVRGSVLTVDQAESQISSLLGEIQSAEVELSHLQGVRESLELELERLTTQLSAGSAGLRMLAAQRQLAFSRVAGGFSLAELDAEVQTLLSGSRRVQAVTARSLASRGLDTGTASQGTVVSLAGG